MNKKQKITMWVAIGVLALMLLVPPWKYVYWVPHNIRLEKPGSYGLIFRPPGVPITSYDGHDLRKPEFSGLQHNVWRIEVDIPRLVLPMAAVAVVAAGLFVTFGSRKKPSR